MGRWITIFSALIIIEFIVFNQRILINAYDDHKEYSNEVLETTESNDDDEFRNTLVVDSEIPDHAIDNRTNTSSDDVIVLNVGGQRITTYRSTLTAVPNSKLALMFAKDEKNVTKSKSKQETVHFLDYNPVQFQYLLDQLRNIKRMPPVPSHEIYFIAPSSGDIRFNFSYMLSDLGLNPDRFLSPLFGTHTNLKVSTLVGWKLCYRGKYDVPFDDTVLKKTCTGQRLLVACRTVTDRKTLIVAGVGRRENIFATCNANSYCSPQMYNGTGFYYAQDYAWGFQGETQLVTNNYQYNTHHYYGGQRPGSFLLSPCDTSDQYSDYRLCWSLRSNTGRGGGDRCGSTKNLHNTKGWERMIYHVL